jgi:chitinase
MLLLYAVLVVLPLGGAGTPESDAAFCARYGKNCGWYTNVDNGGQARTANCGACAGGQTYGVATSNVSEGPRATSNAKLWIAPHHPCYQWDDVPAGRVPWAHLTHLIIGYLWPVSSSQGYSVGLPGGWTRGWQNWRENAKRYVESGHSAGRKVILFLGGAGGNPGRLWNAASAPANAATFARNITTLLKPIGLDGVELDWEDGRDPAGVVRIALELRAQWPEAIITMTTSPMGDDAAELAPAKVAVDAFMPMTYLSVSQWGGWLIPVPLTPLFGPPRPGSEPNPYSVDLVRTRWERAGVPAAKLVMGVGGFGSAWTDTQSDGVAPVAPYSNQDLQGPADTETGASLTDNAVSGAWLKRTVAANPALQEGWDDVGKCSYWRAPSKQNLVAVADAGGRTVKVGIIFYESRRSMQEKVNYCNQHGMKGMMFWTLSQMMEGTSCPILQATQEAAANSRAQR